MFIRNVYMELLYDNALGSQNLFSKYRQIMYGWVLRRTNTVNIILPLSDFNGGGKQVPSMHYFRHERAFE